MVMVLPKCMRCVILVPQLLFFLYVVASMLCIFIIESEKCAYGAALQLVHSRFYFCLFVRVGKKAAAPKVEKIMPNALDKHLMNLMEQTRNYRCYLRECCVSDGRIFYVKTMIYFGKANGLKSRIKIFVVS